MQCFHGLNKEKMHFREWMAEFEQAIISSRFVTFNLVVILNLAGSQTNNTWHPLRWF